MACESAVVTPAPTSIQMTNVTTAIAMTAGTNTPEILSASFSIGAFELVASSTMRTIPASTVSAPTCSARMANQPVRFTVAPVTAEPTAFSTGTLSPVMTDSSTVPAPSTTTPSTGTPAPARTMRISPGRTWSAGISSSLPAAFLLMAVLGERSMSLEMASVVLPFARASKYFPSVMRVRIIAADSKYRSIDAM